MRSVPKFFIIAAMISFPLSLNSQVKIDLKKKVITIDKNAKADVKKDVAKDQVQNNKQNQGTQEKQSTSIKNDSKTAEGTKSNTGTQIDVQEQQSMQSYSTYGTLKGIADVLNENPEVKVKIVGHTDSDGADAANLDLSKRRGGAVKAELVKSFGIDASRLEADGMGETQPVASNDTPANKALNRRVELIKL
jgi:outer membrane protein OmpA-like peptidoglycan-associated protein